MEGTPALPFPRPDLLGIPPLLRELRERCPITRVRTRTGDEAWMVMGHAELVQLFCDGRLGRSHPHPERAARLSGSLLGGPVGDPVTEDADTKRMHTLLTPFFSARRMRALRPRVEALGTGCSTAWRPPPLRSTCTTPSRSRSRGW